MNIDSLVCFLEDGGFFDLAAQVSEFDSVHDISVDMLEDEEDRAVLAFALQECALFGDDPE